MTPPVDPRILQANERTLLAWVRTGLALMGFGFVVARFALLVEEQGGRAVDGAALYLGVAVVALGAVCEVLGAIRFVVARRALLAGRELEPGNGPVVVAGLVAALGVALLVHLLG